MESKKIISHSEKEVQQDEKQKTASRRGFLKKAAWSAPVLIGMGQLAKPTLAHADGTGGPGGPPDDGWARW